LQAAEPVRHCSHVHGHLPASDGPVGRAPAVLLRWTGLSFTWNPHVLVRPGTGGVTYASGGRGLP